ncbi:hypothetical protein [Aliiglaciecola litoralis]|uniref:Uncharacterized protein n=1 Tax=Aliiglaciecola litoralis TaxID=582857 RepID=A0ABN1LHY1_9ALTE
MNIAKSNLLLNQQNFSILEIEIVSDYVSNIRSSVFKILSILLDSDYLELAKQLRRNIFYNLKVPQNDWRTIFINTPFAQPESNTLAIYGEDIAGAISDINNNLKHVNSFGNPLNKAFYDFLAQCKEDENCVVFTESKFKDDFQLLINSFGISSLNIKVISTISEYKELEKFNTLLIVGSIRIDEYSAIPNFFLRNIKFHRLAQLRWSGQKNDYYAFLTPISRLRQLFSGEAPPLPSIEIQKMIVKFNCDLPKSVIFQEDIDEFEVYKKLSLDSFPALCFKLFQGKSVLYSPNSKIIIIVKESNKASVQHMKAAEAANFVNENVLIVSFDIPDKYSRNRADKAQCYQSIWKSVLMEQDFDTFLGELERSNIGLKNLSSCVSDWCEISDNVVKAPQEKENFLILLDCLKIDILANVGINVDDFGAWAEAAWGEVLSSRGEAISEGLQHSSEYEEQVYQAINKLIKEHSNSIDPLIKEGFTISVNSEKCDVELHQLQSTEYGYEVPKKLLKKIITAQESRFYR